MNDLGVILGIALLLTGIAVGITKKVEDTNDSRQNFGCRRAVVGFVLALVGLGILIPAL